jgi:hypothetical protein
MRNLVFLAVVMLSACAQDIHVVGSTLTSSATLALGRAIPASDFSTTESVRFITRFSWPNVDTPGGLHQVDFRWFKDGVLISHTHRVLSFTSTPYSVFTNRSAASLGPGHFSVETDVDHLPVGTASFTVHA